MPKPYALIQAITEQDAESLEWKGLAEQRLRQAWQGEDNAFLRLLVGKDKWLCAARLSNPMAVEKEDHQTCIGD